MGIALLRSVIISSISRCTARAGTTVLRGVLVGLFGSSVACSSLSERFITPSLTNGNHTAELSPTTLGTLAELGYDSSRLPNLERLEADDELQRLTTDDERALVLSELWALHGQTTLKSSPGGGIAAYLRSSELALTALLSQSCSSAFNSTCSALRTQYAASTLAVVKHFQANNWSVADASLAPTRYSLSLEGEDRSLSLSLSDWSISFGDETPPVTPDFTTAHLHKSSLNSPGIGRPGIGVVASGCRTVVLSRDSVRVCSPLTFVLSFSSPTANEPNDQRTEATLSVYNAYEREVVAVVGRDVPLAGDIAAAFDAITASPSPDNLPIRSAESLLPLRCLSVPSSGVVTVVVLSTEESLKRYSSTAAQLLADPGIRSRFTFCFSTSTQENRDNIGKVADSNRSSTVLTDIQELIQPRADTSLVQKTYPIALVSFDSSGHKAAAEIVRGMKSRKSNFSLRGVITVTGATRSLPQETKKLKASLRGSAPAGLVAIQEASSGGNLRRVREELRGALLRLPTIEQPQQKATTPEDGDSELSFSSVL